MSQSHDRATAQYFPDLVQNPEICMRKPKFMHFSLFYSFCFTIHTYYVIFDGIFALFLAQNLKSKVLIAQKNLLLKCMQQLVSLAYQDFPEQEYKGARALS